jgi:hypothetical protein
MKRFVRLYGIGYSQISTAVVKKLASACPTCEEAPEAIAIIAFPAPSSMGRRTTRPYSVT